jgi:signal transduction histidine kinase
VKIIRLLLNRMAVQLTIMFFHPFIFNAVHIEASPVIILIITLLGFIIAGYAVLVTRKNKFLSAYKININQHLIINTVLSQEAERKRIASAIHDNFCARLSIIKLMLHNAESGNTPTEAVAQLDEAYHEARLLSHHLDPPVLDKSGLLDAIRDYIRPLYNLLKVEMYILQTFTPRLTKFIELHLFRIVQEAITNTIKHASASILQIDIHFSEHLAALRITDNGIGFNIENKPSGAGLKNIKLRVAMLNGNYRMRSQPNMGSSLLITIPLKNNQTYETAPSESLQPIEDDGMNSDVFSNFTNPFLQTHEDYFAFGISRRRTPFYKRNRSHRTSKHKTQDTLRSYRWF